MSKIRLLNFECYLISMLLLIILFSPSLTGTGFANVWPVFVFFLILFSGFVFRINLKGVFFVFPFIIFLFFTILSCILNSDINIYLYLKEIFRSIVYILIFIFFYSVGIRSGDRSFEFICKSIVIFSIISLICLILLKTNERFEDIMYFLYYNNAGDESFINYARARMSLTIGNPNSLAFCSSLLFFVFLLKNNQKNISYYFVLLSLFVVFALALSRTGYLVFFICTIFCIIFYYNKMWKSILVVFSILIFIPILFNNFYQGFIQRISNTDMGGREIIWYEALTSKFFLENFWVGMPVIPDGQFIDNDYITILFKFGFLSFMVYIFSLLILFFKSLSWCFICIKKSNFNKDNAVLLFICVLHLLIFSISASLSTVYKIMLVFLPILALSLSSLSFRSKNESFSYFS